MPDRPPATLTDPTPPADGPRRKRLERIAGWSSIGAGAVHAAVAREHFEEWWGYGLFFVLASLLQVLLALALLTDAINERDAGPRAASLRRLLYALGLAGNLALVVMYIVTRTTGIPALGPGAGEVEAWDPAGILSKVFEAVAIVALAALLWNDRKSAADPPAAPSVPPAPPGAS